MLFIPTRSVRHRRGRVQLPQWDDSILPQFVRRCLRLFVSYSLVWTISVAATCCDTRIWPYVRPIHVQTAGIACKFNVSTLPYCESIIPSSTFSACPISPSSFKFKFRPDRFLFESHQFLDQFYQVLYRRIQIPFVKPFVFALLRLHDEAGARRLWCQTSVVPDV